VGLTLLDEPDNSNPQTFVDGGEGVWIMDGERFTLDEVSGAIATDLPRGDVEDHRRMLIGQTCALPVEDSGCADSICQ